jgi:hypothetical protein
MDFAAAWISNHCPESCCSHDRVTHVVLSVGTFTGGGAKNDRTLLCGL